MRVIIAGAGEVGRGVAAALREERRQVALIDPDPEAINESQSLDCLLVTGNALSRDSLLRAGDRKSTRLNSSHSQQSRMPSSA